MTLNDKIAEDAVDQFGRESDRYAKLTRLVEEICTKIVRDAGIPATFQSRVKSQDSLRRKLQRYLDEGNAKINLVDTATDALTIVGDLAAVRVATYVEADRARVLKLITSEFRGPNDGMVDVDVKEKEQGYRATHCQVMLPRDATAADDLSNIRDTSAEIQICSMLGHVWSEIEHDLRYKSGVDWGENDSFLDLLLGTLRRTVDDGDRLIEELLRLHSQQIARSISPVVGGMLPELRSFDENGVDVLKEFVRLGYSTAEAISDKLGLDRPDEAVARGRRLIDGHYSAFKLGDVPAELFLDPANADVLLALLVDLHGPDLVALSATSGGEGIEPPSRAARVAIEVQKLEAPIMS